MQHDTGKVGVTLRPPGSGRMMGGSMRDLLVIARILALHGGIHLSGRALRGQFEVVAGGSTFRDKIGVSSLSEISCPTSGRVCRFFGEIRCR